MEPGRRADEQARLARERIHRLRRDLANAERRQQAWEAGAAGERLVAATLDELRGAGWHLLHDVSWPGRARANLDHIAVGPAGIYVIDTKNWTGDVAVRGGVLRQNGYRRERETRAVGEACAAIAALLDPPHRTAVRPVVCLVNAPMTITATADGTTVVGLEQLLETLTAGGDVGMTAAAAERIYRLLRVRLGGDGGMPELAIRELPTTQSPRLSTTTSTAGRRRLASSTTVRPRARATGTSLRAAGARALVVLVFVLVALLAANSAVGSFADTFTRSATPTPAPTAPAPTTADR